MVVTLLTDFGLADTYVGQVKGAILTVAPGAQLVDLTHSVPPQDIRTGAFHLWSAVAAFPAGSVHLAVVDPGVGTARRAVAVKTIRGDVLVGPDNGLLMPAAARLGGVDVAVQLREPAYFRSVVSSTFHGRDVFGPVAGHLANGASLDRLGPAIGDLAHPIAFPPPRDTPDGLRGEVLHVDVYGNLITSFDAETLPVSFVIDVAGRRITGAPHEHYQAVPRGELLAVLGSSGTLEISVRDGDAASLLGIRAGAPVTVRRL